MLIKKIKTRINLPPFTKSRGTCCQPRLSYWMSLTSQCRKAGFSLDKVFLRGILFRSMIACWRQFCKKLHGIWDKKVLLYNKVLKMKKFKISSQWWKNKKISNNYLKINRCRIISIFTLIYLKKQIKLINVTWLFFFEGGLVGAGRGGGEMTLRMKKIYRLISYRYW